MSLFRAKNQPSQAQFTRLPKQPSGQTRAEGPALVAQASELPEQPELIDDDLPVSPVIDREPASRSRRSQAASEPVDEENTDDGPLTDGIGKYLRVVGQLQNEIALIRREQEYLLKVTESSQAFLETLSRELLSVIELILRYNEEGLSIDESVHKFGERHADNS